MSSVAMLTASLLTGLVSLGLLWQMWTGRRKISCMAAMMVAMAGAMFVGLIVGVMAAAGMPGSLWPPTLAAALAGVAAGVLLGLPVSLMAVLDGGLAGIMGGMMGSMLGMMAPQDLTAITGFLLFSYLVCGGLLTVVLGQEVGYRLDRFRVLAVAMLAVTLFIVSNARTAGEAPGGSSHGISGDHSRHPVTVELEATDFAFDRPVVEVQRGRPVRLVLRNEGKIQHDVAVSGLAATVTRAGRHGQGLHAHALPGGVDYVEFIPLRSGTFEAGCTIPGHKEAGMRVSVNVIE